MPGSKTRGTGITITQKYINSNIHYYPARWRYFSIDIGRRSPAFSHIAGSLWGKWSFSCLSLSGAWRCIRRYAATILSITSFSGVRNRWSSSLDDVIERMRNADDMNPVRKIAEDAERLMMGETVDWYALICSKILINQCDKRSLIDRNLHFI